MAAASSATANLSQLQALAQKSGAAADQQLAGEIDRIVRTTRITKSDQDPGDTQKFFNATGISARKPATVRTEMDLENEINAGNQSLDYQYYIFHGDRATSSAQGRQYAEQLHGKSDQYIPSGRLGDGIYFSTSPSGSASYMDRTNYGRQTKAILNHNARVISDSALSRKISGFKRSHPKAYARIMAMTGSKNNSWGADAKKSVFATLFGYNVVTDGSGRKVQDHYLAVFDRSALTVVTGETLRRGDVRSRSNAGQSAWRFQNHNED